MLNILCERRLPITAALSLLLLLFAFLSILQLLPFTLCAAAVAATTTTTTAAIVHAIISSKDHSQQLYALSLFSEFQQFHPNTTNALDLSG